MTLSRRSAGLAGLAVALLSCGSGSTATTAASVGDPGPHGTVAVATCGGREFPPSALHRPADAERGGDAPAALLRSFTASSRGGMLMPAHGWIEVLRSDTQAVFYDAGGAVTTGTIPDHATMPGGSAIVMEQKDGRWSVANWGVCNPVTELRSASYDVVPWRLDPQAPAPGPDGTSLVIDEITMPCGPDDSRDRFDHAAVDETGTTVTITVFLRPRPSPPALPSGQSYGCLTIDRFTRHTLHLPHPLGARTLLDGETQPPRPPRTP